MSTLTKLLSRFKKKKAPIRTITLLDPRPSSILGRLQMETLMQKKDFFKFEGFESSLNVGLEQIGDSDTKLRELQALLETLELKHPEFYDKYYKERHAALN